jgi:ferredoxin
VSTIVGLQVEADRDGCVGAGQCVLAAPDVFDQDDDGIVLVVQEYPDPSRAEAIREATELCPARVLFLSETASANAV